MGRGGFLIYSHTHVRPTLFILRPETEKNHSWNHIRPKVMNNSRITVRISHKNKEGTHLVHTAPQGSILRLLSFTKLNKNNILYVNNFYVCYSAIRFLFFFI